MSKKKTPVTAKNSQAVPREIRSAADLRGLRQERKVLIKREAIDVESRTVNMSFATETPVERFYGFEILDCTAKSVRLDRLRSGAPILVGHDGDDQVGVVEDVSMDEDRTGRVVSRYSKSTRGEEIFQDIVDGIRRNTSVGYVIHEAVMEREEDGVPTYRITDWEPYEVSIVSMPADIKSGVGREADFTQEQNSTHQQEKRAMKKCTFCGVELETGVECSCDGAVAERQKRNHEKFAADRKEATEEARKAELKRIADIREAGKQFASRGGEDIAQKVIEDPNGTVETFRKLMLDKIDQEQEQGEKTRREGHVEYGQSARTSLRYDRRSLDPFLRQAGGNQRDAEKAAYTAGKWARAVLFDDDGARRWCTDNGLDLRVMSSNVGSEGAFLVPDQLESAIIDLRAEYGVARRLAELWPMGTGSAQVPVRKSGTSAYFVGEKDATTASDMGWGQVNLVAKEVSALTRISKSLTEDAIIDIASKVADEHAYAFAVKEDSCMIDGDGTSTYGGIVGLKALLETSGMAGIFTAASNTDTPQEVIAKELSGVMAKLPSYARAGAVWVASPAFDELIFGRLMAAAGGNTTATLAGEIMPAYLGKPRVVCEPCYSDDTADLTGSAMLFYGNFKQGILLGERRGMMVDVLRERYAEYRQIGVIGTERIDINCHGVGDTSTAGPIVALIGG